MSPLEIRLIAYVLAGLVYTGFVSWGAVTLTSRHYEAKENAQQVERDKVTQAQQEKAIADLRAQQTATQAAEQKYADLKSATSGISDQLSRSVSDYSALRRGLLSANANTAALADAARESAESDQQLTELVRQATSACLEDSTALTALQTWAASLPK